MLARIRSLVSALTKRDRFERAMRDEMEFHLDARAHDLERSGLTPAEARRRAHLEFGGVDAAREDCRDARGLRVLDELSQDLRYTVRIMAKAPGFTGAAVVSLALGIGANTAIFSLMDAVMLRTLAVPNADELVFLAHGTSPERAGASSNYPLFERYQTLADVFSGVTAYSTTGFKVATAEGVDSVDGLWVSGNFHAVMGVDIAHGRGFSAERDRAIGSAMIAVISDRYWTVRFDRDRDVLGRTIAIDGRPITIVGVTAPTFTGLVPGIQPDITLPLSIRPLNEPKYLDRHDTWTNLTIVGRIRPEVGESAALAASDVAFQQYMSEPENQWVRKQSTDGAYANAVLVPAAKGSGVLRRQYGTALNLLMGMVVAVLLIASVNVANLQLVRSGARQKEVAIRLCVGARRTRIIRQFLTESVFLAVCGGALGLLAGIWGTSGIMRLLSATESPMLLDVAPNSRVLAFTALVSLVTGIGFGLVPAFKATRLDLTPALKEGALSGTVRRWVTAHVLVASQLALSVVVLAIAALLSQTLYNLKTIDAGFARENLLLFTVDSYRTAVRPEAWPTVYADIVEAVHRLPGVRSAAGSRSSPVHTSGNARALVIPEGILLADTPDARGAWTNYVTPEYFETLGIRLLRGRTLNAQDTSRAPKIAVINETMARFYAQYFGVADPVGHTVSFRGNPKEILTIVGIVEDTHQMNLREPPPRTVYTPVAQELQLSSQMMVEIRTTQDPATLANAARDAVRAVNKDVVVRYVRTMEEQINASLVRERVLAALSSGFALLALVLSAVGLYGVMAYSVSRRVREIGIRMALGARRAGVLWQVLRPTITMSLTGVVIGIVASLVVTRKLTTFMYDLSPHDPWTLAAVAIALLLTAVVAGVLPARRAATLDPARAIRTE